MVALVALIASMLLRVCLLPEQLSGFVFVQANFLSFWDRYMLLSLLIKYVELSEPVKACREKIGVRTILYIWSYFGRDITKKQCGSNSFIQDGVSAAADASKQESWEWGES